MPAALDRRDRLTAERAAALACAIQIEAELRAVMRPLPSPAELRPGSRPDTSPAEVIRFFGRSAELRSLADWAFAHDASPVHVITGPGGTGKTRLAVEFGSRLQSVGWRCGFLEADQGRQAVGAISQAGHPTLLVVDYAGERLRNEKARREKELHRQRHRQLYDWWHDMPDGPERTKAMNSFGEWTDAREPYHGGDIGGMPAGLRLPGRR